MRSHPYHMKHHMALDNYCLVPPLDWDLHTLGGAQEALHATFPMCLGSPVSSEASSGYLQDAVVYWSDRCKRQRMALSLSPPPPPPRHPTTANEDIHHLLQNFWDSSAEGDIFHDLNMMIPENSFVSEEDASGSEQLEGPVPKAAAVHVSVVQGREEAVSPTSPCQSHRPRVPIQQKTTDVLRAMDANKYPEHLNNSSHASSTCSSCSSLTGKEKRGIGVLHPFAVIKPLGLDGDTATLRDVNQRILKRPSRPVRHPVGVFASSPCVCPDGLGLSGKAVVSLTRIRTGGKGTITIIRTRG